MEHTKEATALLKELLCASWLPPHQPDKVQRVLQKMVELYKEANALQQLDGFNASDEADLCAPRVCMLTMVRLRNLLLAYVRHRMEKIESLRWDVAGAIPEENLELLSSHEQQYATEYNHLLSNYQFSYDLDLTRDCTPPVDNLMIKVHVLADIGKFVGPESGSAIELRVGDHAFLRRGDVEHLVRQGVLQHLV